MVRVALLAADTHSVTGSRQVCATETIQAPSSAHVRHVEIKNGEGLGTRLVTGKVQAAS